MLELELPYPPSINHYWRMWRGRMVISREGRTFRASVCALLAGGGGSRKPPSGGRVALCMDAFPPDRRRRDLDNIQKPLLDALEHAGVYDDDGLIDLLITRRQEPLPRGCVTARLFSLPLVCCPLCGTALTNCN
ncbi:MAG: RusA family crossover junction endodeoxyribonuclease [Phycisphaera sp.]|nr:RusA family crossover junction endodeoxyribonuclease [Phycisphaera sp.]